MSDFSAALMREWQKYQVKRRHLATACGVSEELIRKWEYGAAIPSVDHHKALSGVLPTMVSHPPVWGWAHEAVLDGRWDAHLAKVRAETDDYLRKHPEVTRRPPARPFGLGLRQIAHEDDMDAGHLASALNITFATSFDEVEICGWMEGVDYPDERTLKLLRELLPELDAAMRVGSVKKPREEEHDMNTMIEPTPDKSTLAQMGDLIKRARTSRELPYRDVANHCGVTVDVVRAWEAGSDVPYGKQWAKLKGMLWALQSAALVWRAALREKAADEVKRSDIHVTQYDATDAALYEAPTSTEASIETVTEAKVLEEEKKAMEEEEETASTQPRILTTAPLPPLQDPKTQTTFGPALRIARLNVGLTQEELGELLEVSGTTISAWETESVSPVLTNWTRLVEALPELKDCAPPGVRNINRGPYTSTPRAVPRSNTPRAAVDDIAQAGIDYAYRLHEVSAARGRVDAARVELDRAEASLKAAEIRVDEAQRALVAVVGGDAS